MRQEKNKKQTSERANDTNKTMLERSPSDLYTANPKWLVLSLLSPPTPQPHWPAWSCQSCIYLKSVGDKGKPSCHTPDTSSTPFLPQSPTEETGDQTSSTTVGPCTSHFWSSVVSHPKLFSRSSNTTYILAKGKVQKKPLIERYLFKM